MPTDPAPAVRPDAPAHRGRWVILLVGWALTLLITDNQIIANKLVIGAPSVSELSLDVTSSADSVLQVYFDTGAGYSEANSVVQPLQAGAANQHLSFPVPEGALRSIRLDPLRTAGKVQLRSVHIGVPNGQDAPRAISFAGATPLSQIAQMTPQPPDGLDVATEASSTDSQILVPLDPPYEGGQPGWSKRLSSLVGVDFSLSLAVLAVAGLMYWLSRPAFWAGSRGRLIRRPINWVHVRFDAISQGFNAPDFISFDRLALWFYAGCVAFFGLSAILGLHGSNVDVYSRDFPVSGVKSAPLLGEVKSIRSDEWYVQTPSMLNQAYRERHFHVVGSSTGPGKSALLSNLPCWHFTQLFRPEFWAFAVLPFDQAFSFFWQAKGFLLLTGVFTLLLVLTESSAAAALGAIWYYFSAYTQWSFSWPSLLPDLVGLFCWVICLTMYLSVGRNRRVLAAAAVCCAIGAVDFAMGAYPPHQVPLVFFGAVLSVWWFATRRPLILRSTDRCARILALGGCWLLVAGVMVAFYFDARTTLNAALDTVYPGRRVSGGGDVPLAELVSHFLDFWKSGSSIPLVQGNICESVGYLWLAPFALVLTRGKTLSRRAGGALIGCCVAAAVVLCWMVLPISPAVGKWIAFDKVPSYRCIYSLGLLNIAIVCLCLTAKSRTANLGEATAVRDDLLPKIWPWMSVMLTAVGVAIPLVLMNQIYNGFFPVSALVFATIYTTLLICCLFWNQLGALALALLTPLILANGLVNPVVRGFHTIKDSVLFKAVQQDPALRQGSWVVFTHDFMPIGFVNATGVKVVNSFKYVPDLGVMSAFDPEHRYLGIYNQSGHVIARPLPVGEPSRFERLDTGMVRWSVSPLDPAMKQVGVCYLAFDEPAPADVVGRLRFIPQASTKAFWVYKLP